MMRERDQAFDLPIKTSRNYTQARNCTAALQTKPYNPIQGQTARNLYSVYSATTVEQSLVKIAAMICLLIISFALGMPGRNR